MKPTYDKSVSTEKRKQNGIFYSPQNIVKYIVSRVLDNYFNLDFTFEKLQKIKILDPACGDGIFLVESYFYLINVYKNHFSDSKNSEKFIIENNLFGVDIDNFAVKMTKKNLFENSNYFCENIMCGNSLISDKATSENAFVWKEEFKEIIQCGGFDIIVGNPPYVSTKVINEIEKKYFVENYKTAVGQFDLYGLFIEKSIKLLHKNSKFGFITSNTYLSNKDFLELRKYLFENVTINEITNLGETVFTDAKIDVAILLFTNSYTENNKIKITLNSIDFERNKFHLISQNRFNSEKNNYEIKLNSKEDDFELIDKIFENKTELSEILDLPRGIEIGSNSEKISTNYQLDFYKLLVGKDISKYNINFAKRHIKFENNKSVFKDLEIYEQPKILIQRIRNLSLKTRIVATLDEDNYLCTNTLRIGILKNKNFNLKYILAILNSNLINWIFSKYFVNKDIYAYQLDRLPICEISSEKQQVFVDLVTEILTINKELNKNKQKFINRIEANYKIERNTKILNFNELYFSELNEELKKQKVTLSLKQQDELEEYFDENKTKLNTEIENVKKIEQQIDKLIYEIYNLTKEEIEIIENAKK